MADENRNVNFKLGATDNTGPGISSARRSIDDYANWLARKSREMRKENAASGETALGGSLRRGGFTGMAGDMLGLGVKGLIAEHIASQSNAMVQGVLEATNQMRSGKATWGDTVEKGLGSLPFGLGHAAQATYGVREIITGEKHAEQMSEQARDLNDKFREARRQTWEAMKKDRRTMQETVYQSASVRRVAEMWERPRDQALAALDEELATINRNAANQKANLGSVIRKQYSTATKGADAAVNSRWSAYQSNNTSENMGLYNQSVRERMDLRGDIEREIMETGKLIEQDAEERRATNAAKKKLLQQQLKEQFEETLRQNQRLNTSEEAAIEAGRLRFSGRGLEADLKMIEQQEKDERANALKAYSDDLKKFGYSDDRSNQYDRQLQNIENRRKLNDAEARDAAGLRRRGDLGALTSMGGSLLDGVASLPGGVRTPEMMAAQYKFAQTQFQRQFSEQLDDIVKNDASLKPLVDQGRNMLQQYMTAAMSPEAIKRATYGAEGPLRLASYDTVPVGYQGLAEAARVGDLRNQTNQTLSMSKKQTELQTKMEEWLKEIAGNTKKKPGEGDLPPANFN